VPDFLKTYPDPEAATRARVRTDAARNSDVPTPAARDAPSPKAVLFDHVAGQSGPALLSRPLTDLLAPLHRLHMSRIPDLAPFDPLLRIRPRAALIDTPELHAIMDAPVPEGTAVLHGDFHVGQLIGAQGGPVWIVDLDDLALGPPEADAANFVAHLATSGKTEEFWLRLPYWRAAVIRAWPATRPALKPEIFTVYLRLALLRRHLKLREAGRPDFGPEIRRAITGVAARISPSGSAAYPG